MSTCNGFRDPYLHIILYTLSMLVSYALAVQHTQEGFQTGAVNFGLDRERNHI